MPSEMDRKVAGIDAQHLDGVAHKALKPIQILVDDRGQLAISSNNRRTRQEMTRSRFHRRERRLELVRQRIQDGRPKLAALPGGLGSRRGFFSPRPLQTDRCEVRHVGYMVQGRLKIVGRDGSEDELEAGDAFVIPPGHDAWTVGNETAILLDVH